MFLDLISFIDYKFPYKRRVLFSYAEIIIVNIVSKL